MYGELFYQRKCVYNTPDSDSIVLAKCNFVLDKSLNFISEKVWEPWLISSFFYCRWLRTTLSRALIWAVLGFPAVMARTEPPLSGKVQNGRHFPDDKFKCISLNETIWISLKLSPKCVPKVRIKNITALVQIMALRRSGDKPLSEPMMVRLLTHIYASLGLNVLIKAVAGPDFAVLGHLYWHGLT